MTDPKVFAEKINSVGGFLPTWMGVTSPAFQYRPFTSPNKVEVVGGDPSKNNWRDAVSNAAKAAYGTVTQPFKGAVPDAIAKSTQTVSEGASDFLKSSASAVSAAGNGITSGFRWTVILLFLGVAFYLYMMLSPFIPKPSR